MGDGGDAEGSRWVTYAELAQIRGIARLSASKLVKREGWRRQHGNGRDQTVRALVPAEWLSPAREGSEMVGKSTGPPPGNGVDIPGLMAGWEQAVTLARTRAEAAELRADRAETRADRADQDRREAVQRADELRDQLETARHEAAEARQAAEELKRTEDAWETLPTWRRVLVALRRRG